MCQSVRDSWTLCHWAGLEGFWQENNAAFMEPPKDCIGCAACAMYVLPDYIQCVDEGDTRTIWNRNFTLIRCPICGEAHTTEEALEYLGLEDLDARLCPRCRKREYAAKFKIFVP